PQNCFVLDGYGLAVAYILGTDDSTDHVNQWPEQNVPFLKAQGIEKPGPGIDTIRGDSVDSLREIAQTPRE
ncbi:hypothetical protein DOTSEDRAFT_120261, partial [Dothistroma septosporum NZE10]